jgi:hypothetical protein
MPLSVRSSSTPLGQKLIFRGALPFCPITPNIRPSLRRGRPSRPIGSALVPLLRSKWKPIAYKEQEWQVRPQKPLPKPLIPPMAQQHRSGLTITMLQEFEHYFQGSKEALIGFGHVQPYLSSDLATPRRATTFNRLFLAGLHPELHRQALGDMSRETKAMSLSFDELVTELRTYLIDKTIGNDFAEFCHWHRQTEGQSVYTNVEYGQGQQVLALWQGGTYSRKLYGPASDSPVCYGWASALKHLCSHLHYAFLGSAAGHRPPFNQTFTFRPTAAALCIRSAVPWLPVSNPRANLCALPGRSPKLSGGVCRAQPVWAHGNLVT